MAQGNLFETYEKELQLAFKVIEEKIELLKTGKNKHQLVKEIDAEFDTAQDTIDQMSMVAKSTYGGQALTTKVNNFLEQMAKLRKETERFGKTSALHDKQRGQIMAGKAVVDQSSQRLNDTHRIALETEEIGSGALNRLVTDREKVVGALEEMEVVDGKVERTRTILTSMGRGIVTNKIILVFIILILIAAIGIITYVKWIAPLIIYLAPVFNPPVAPMPAPQVQPPVAPPVAPIATPTATPSTARFF